jgi:hypothetical protein
LIKITGGLVSSPISTNSKFDIMGHRVKAMLLVLVTSVAMGIVGFGCYHSGYVEGRIETTLMYEDLVALQEKEVADTFHFSEDNLKVILTKLNVKFPEIVMAQARLETGRYSSRVYTENNNLFGMKQAYKRPSTCKGMKYGHCYYDDWLDSVIDYVLYQRVFLSHVTNPDDYLRILEKSYAEDPKYAKKLRILMQEES